MDRKIRSATPPHVPMITSPSLEERCRAAPPPDFELALLPMGFRDALFPSFADAALALAKVERSLATHSLGPRALNNSRWRQTHTPKKKKKKKKGSNGSENKPNFKPMPQSLQR